MLAGDCAGLMAIVDPTGTGRALAVERGTHWYPDVATMLHNEQPEGTIISTPNQMHVAHGLEVVAAGVLALVEADERAGVPLMTGHHRRHNPMIQTARQAIDGGQFGQTVSVQGACCFYKPDDCFDIPWRREKGAGPVFLNLIHDVNLFRYLCGDVVGVQAMESNALRGNAVEETAVILLRFASGLLGAVNVSDEIVSPLELEAHHRREPGLNAHAGSLLPNRRQAGRAIRSIFRLWRNPTKPSWPEPIERKRLPVVSGREGWQTLRVIEAVKHGGNGRAVRMD